MSHFPLASNNGPIIFKIDPVRSGKIFKIGQCVISVRLKLVKIKTDGTTEAPDDGADVCLKNNSLNTLFSKSLITINDVSVSNAISLKVW